MGRIKKQSPYIWDCFFIDGNTIYYRNVYKVFWNNLNNVTKVMYKIK